jgi:hypothetical protein
MTKLALDLGTTTGFAHSPTAGCVLSGTWDFTPKKFENRGMRWLRFKNELDTLHKASPITVLWFELVRRHLGTDAAHIYGGFLAKVEEWCEANGVPYEGVGVGTIKKFWTGKGNANKDAMVAEAVRRGYEPDDDNEADAIALLVLKCPEAEGDVRLVVMAEVGKTDASRVVGTKVAA